MASSVDTADHSDEETERICRFCHTEEYPESGGELIAPCLCKGTQRYVHKYCLQVWQQHNQEAGTYRKARYCDVCSSEYILFVEGAKPATNVVPPRSRPVTFSHRPVARIIFQIWQGYAICNGAIGAIRLGWAGFRTGQSFGLAPSFHILRLVLHKTTKIRPAVLRVVVWGAILKTSSAFYQPLTRIWKDVCYLSVCLAAAGSAYGLCTSYVRTIKWTIGCSAGVTARTAVGVLHAVVRTIRKFAMVFRRAACLMVMR